MLSRLPLPLSPRRPLPPLPLLALAAFALPGAAHAELKVRLSRPVVGCYEPVRITVNDPLGGLDANPGPITLTIADNQDHRRELLLDPTSRPGEWSGFFTPRMPGRYTGSAMLARGDEKELGLVPLLRVRASERPGFLRMARPGRRSFEYPNRDNLFPIGVRLVREDVAAPRNWLAEVRRLRANGVNYLEVPVAWPGNASAAEQLEAAKRIDAIVEAAGSVGRPMLQLRLEGPARLTEESTDAYSAQLVRWVRRWSYSPAVAVWQLAGIPVNASPDQCSRLVRAVRFADAYNHMVAIPGTPNQLRGGADLVVTPLDPAHVSNQRAILEAPTTPGQVGLPGEGDWQMLALGGVGLPLPAYRPDSPDAEALLVRLRLLAAIAATVPYQAAATPMTDVVPVDTPGAFCRYDSVTVGWVAPDAVRTLRLRFLPRGTHRVRFWNPETGERSGELLTESNGREARVPLPPRRDALFLLVTRADGGSRARVVRVMPRGSAPAVVTPPAAVVTPVAPPRPQPTTPEPPVPVEPAPRPGPDPAELAAQREEARREAARRAAAARARRAALSHIRAERNARRRAILQRRYEAQVKWEEHLARKRAREKRVAVWMKRRAVLQARYNAQKKWEEHLARKHHKERAAAKAAKSKKTRKAKPAPAKKAKRKRGR